MTTKNTINAFTVFGLVLAVSFAVYAAFVIADAKQPSDLLFASGFVISLVLDFFLNKGINAYINNKEDLTFQAAFLLTFSMIIPLVLMMATLQFSSLTQELKVQAYVGLLVLLGCYFSFRVVPIDYAYNLKHNKPLPKRQNSKTVALFSKLSTACILAFNLILAFIQFT